MLRCSRFCVLGLLLSALSIAFLGDASGQLPRVSKRDDLPRRVYPVTTSATQLVQSPEALSPLAKQLRADLESDLGSYEIEDKTTLKAIHQVLLQLDLLDQNFDSALRNAHRIRDLEDKEGLKQTVALTVEAGVAAFREVGRGDGPEYRAAFARHYRDGVRSLTWSNEIQDVLEHTKGQLEMLSEPLLLGMVQAHLDPVVAEAKELTGAQAEQVLAFHLAIHRGLATKAEVVQVLQEVLAEHVEQKPDIWAARSLDLTNHAGLHPVRVAVWDTGVDPSVFAGKMYDNAHEVANGVDDDANGFVDDLHGFAHDSHWNPTTGALYPMDESVHPAADLEKHFKGLFDLQANVDSKEAQALRATMASLAAEEVASFMEDLTRYVMYSHGTHVAGIAVETNPAAEIVYARLTANVEARPEKPTMEESVRGATAFQDAVRYFKEREVRVVNMSWVLMRSEIEAALEANNAGESPEERKEQARQMFEVVKAGLEKAFASAPEILFVGGAGNSDNDVTFDEMVPPMLELPNLLIAGAVDQAGDPTTFTSFGSTVEIYSNGFEVDSYVPGGNRMKLSGTSMSSPNVANLAAKLIALDPKLTPAEVKRLILDGADVTESGGHQLRIMNPKRSAELLAGR